VGFTICPHTTSLSHELHVVMPEGVEEKANRGEAWRRRVVSVFPFACSENWKKGMLFVCPCRLHEEMSHREEAEGTMHNFRQVHYDFTWWNGSVVPLLASGSSSLTHLCCCLNVIDGNLAKRVTKGNDFLEQKMLTASEHPHPPTHPPTTHLLFLLTWRFKLMTSYVKEMR